MNKKLVCNNNIMLIIVGILILICILVCKFSIAYADEVIEYEKSFVSIEIKDGDTLTSIAKTYATSEAAYEDYISEVMSINNLQNDTIHTGCYLLIPVYEIASSY